MIYCFIFECHKLTIKCKKHLELLAHSDINEESINERFQTVSLHLNAHHRRKITNISNLRI